MHDFNVWSLDKRIGKLHDMHRNPLNRKLVDPPNDWPWSSFSFYSNSKDGLIRVDPSAESKTKLGKVRPSALPKDREGTAIRNFKSASKAGAPGISACRMQGN